MTISSYFKILGVSIC